MVFEVKTDQNLVFGQSQSTILAGGRYDYLAYNFGHKGPLPAVGWAAGINRLVMLLQDMEEKGILKTRDQLHSMPVIGIAAHCDSSELTPEVELELLKYCLNLQRDIPNYG